MTIYSMRKPTMFIAILFCGLFVSISCNDDKGTMPPQSEYLGLTVVLSSEHQTMRNFGASDAWSCQFVGKNWPVDKREQIADLLFSRSLESDGSPKGIGLTAWRFNIGAGSAEQGSQSDIWDEWRRAEGFMQPDGSYDWSRHEGQRWFLKAAKQRQVETLIGFVNSPPVAMTKNGKAYSSGGSSSNLPESEVDAYASFLSDVVVNLEANDGIILDYISPFNEPQWDWSAGGQEGSPWQNSEIADVVRALNDELIERGVSTKIELPEAAQLEYLYKDHNRPGRGNQIEEFFRSSSSHYIGQLDQVAQKVAGHSYYTTWTTSKLISIREDLDSKLKAYPELEFWMTEYTLLEDNPEIQGNGRDLHMDPALYMARVIHTDLVVANANAWHWWLGVSPYDYKDGLVYIDWNKSDGDVYESKMLWALGNYSRFVLPGMKRIEVRRSDNRGIEETMNGVMVSAFKDPATQKAVAVAVNYSEASIPVKIDIDDAFIECSIYQTSSQHSLKKLGETQFNEPVKLAPRSVTTFVQR